MRLTNIAQATLPPGAVHSYALRPVGPRGRALPVSFDQGRHVGAGDRPGSWMSIALRLPPGTTRDALAAAWERAVDRHGTFRTVFGLDDAGEPTLHEITLGDGAWEEHHVPEGIATREVVREGFDLAWVRKRMRRSWKARGETGYWQFDRPDYDQQYLLPERFSGLF